MRRYRNTLLREEINACGTAHQVQLVASLNPVPGDFDEPAFTAGQASSFHAGDAVRDQEDSHGSGRQLSMKAVTPLRYSSPAGRSSPGRCGGTGFG